MERFKVWTQPRLLSQLVVPALPKGCAFHPVANAGVPFIQWQAKLYSFGNRGDVFQHDVSFESSLTAIRVAAYMDKTVTEKPLGFSAYSVQAM